MVDPQKLAKNWLQKLEKENKLLVISYYAPNLLEKLAKSIEYGVPVLLEISEKLDSSFDGLLGRNVFAVDNQVILIFPCQCEMSQ